MDQVLIIDIEAYTHELVGLMMVYNFVSQDNLFYSSSSSSSSLKLCCLPTYHFEYVYSHQASFIRREKKKKRKKMVNHLYLYIYTHWRNCFLE